MICYFSCSLLLASLAFPGTLLAEVVFRCPSCTAERQAGCPKLATTCAEIVREPGCGCCPVCARLEGEACGVYTPRCSSGLRCYPKPEVELPLEELVQGSGRCGRRVDEETTGSPHNAADSGEVQYQSEVSPTDNEPEDRNTNGPRLKPNPKTAAIRHHQLVQGQKWFRIKIQEEKKLRPKLSKCQQELDNVLERISQMPFSDDRGPLEHLYALHIPNCDKRGQYNLKQCKMSLNGQRGECWCVDPHTGNPIPESPMVRGDPNCIQYISGLQTEPPVVPQK
ncbi:insulin-like growth factor-binding protein 2-A isoform X1 [Amia ocellicauda]|uniref:insulin-like growth factor-binding protein 2-A isoform X1 n=1 Tax=Amia ocellicauda TaxID=2972642 RepID=UPI00346419EE